MDMNMFYGILIPFVGTSAGAACVFFMKKDLNQWVQRCLTGFAAGVMVAASVWSLLIPAIEQVSDRKCTDHIDGRACIVAWNRNPEFPGGRNYLPAASF